MNGRCSLLPGGYPGIGCGGQQGTQAGLINLWSSRPVIFSG